MNGIPTNVETRLPNCSIAHYGEGMRSRAAVVTTGVGKPVRLRSLWNSSIILRRSLQRRFRRGTARLISLELNWDRHVVSIAAQHY